jgi:hypothetical protein
MKTVILALLVAAAALAIIPIASAYEWSTPQEQAAALKAARAILAQHGIRHVTLDRPCTYETKSSPPESVPHGYAVTWCNLSFTGAGDRVIPTPKNLPRYHVKQPTVAGFIYPPGFRTPGDIYDDDTLEYVTSTTYHGPEGWGDPTLSGGNSVTIDGTTYSVPQ